MVDPLIWTTDPALQIPPHHFLQKGWTCHINADELRNGHHPGGSTSNSDPKSTHASDASMPNAYSSLGADDTDARMTVASRDGDQPRNRFSDLTGA